MEKTAIDLPLDVLKGLEGTNFSTAKMVDRDYASETYKDTGYMDWPNRSFPLHVPGRPNGKWGKKGNPEQYIDAYPITAFAGIDGKYTAAVKKLIPDNTCLELLKSNKYSFLPEVLHSTDKYVYVEKFNDYITPDGEDFLHDTTLARIILGMPVTTVKFSAFGEDVLNKLKALYSEQIIDNVTVSDMIKAKAISKPGEFKKYEMAEKVGICFDQIRLKDFAIKRDGNKIVDWKYIGIYNIAICPALNYLILDENAPDCSAVEIEKDATYCGYNSSWYKVA